MTVLLAASGAAEATRTSGNLVATTNSSYIAPYVSEGFTILYKNGSNTALYDARFDLASALTEGWTSFYMYYGDTDSTNWDHYLWSIWSSTEEVFALRRNINSSVFRVYYSTSSGSIQNEAAPSSPGTGLHRWDIHWKIAADGTGVFEVYVDYVLWYSRTGQNNGNGSSIMSLRFIREGGGSGNVRAYSAIMIADEDTRPLDVVHQAPDGAGSENDWTGSYANVDGAGADLADRIVATATGQQILVTFPALPGALAASDPVYMALKTTGHGVEQGVKAIVLVSAAVFDMGTVLAAPATGAGITTDISQNPDTEAPWTISEIDGAEFGYETIAA